MLRSTTSHSESGASALIVTIALVLLLGFAAIAIDVGAGMVERRVDQTSADVGALAGAVEALNGGLAVRDQALDFVRRNLPTTYSSADWESLWEGCVDPAAVRNAGGYNFVALTPPAGWSVTDPANWCISFEPRGLLRVRVPDQAVETAFGRILGVDELNTSAAGVARLRPRGAGGILPFGLPPVAGDGAINCLSSGPTGQAQDPCDGSSTGNFGVLKARQFGNPDIPTLPNCTASPLPQTLAQNIAVGIDHIVVPDPDGLDSNEVRDECFNPLVDTLNTDTGFPNNGAEEGLVGPVPGGFTPRLERSPAGSRTTIVNGESIDNRPLWGYLLSSGVDYGGTGTVGVPGDDAPASCDPSTFAGAGTMDWDGNGVPDDYDGDGLPDAPESWQHMAICLRQYVGDSDFNGPQLNLVTLLDDSIDSSPYSTVVFAPTIGENQARFSYVPQFWPEAELPPDSLGSGSEWLHIRRFRAVYLQSTAWKKGTSWVFHHPGETCAGCTGGGWSMKQLSAFVLPDAALPQELRGDPPPGGTGLNPFNVELFR
jgi:hypothetical protein